MDIEKLAEITAREFGTVHEKFAEMDRQFDGVNERLDRLDGSVKAVLEAVVEIPTKKIY
jgi:archaellum component FlaC